MRILFLLFFTLNYTLFFPTSLKAQDDSRLFAIVDYMKVAPEMYAEYLACENAWKTLHQERVKAGSIISWELEEVVYSGVNEEYNFMTITVVQGWAATERGGMEEIEKLMESVPADQRKYIEGRIVCLVFWSEKTDFFSLDNSLEDFSLVPKGVDIFSWGYIFDDDRYSITQK